MINEAEIKESADNYIVDMGSELVKFVRQRFQNFPTYRARYTCGSDWDEEGNFIGNYSREHEIAKK